LFVEVAFCSTACALLLFVDQLLIYVMDESFPLTNFVIAVGCKSCFSFNG